ncbi:CusA/CzcA family heavy metal efflux RND transporter [Aliarcobacter butzleri]|uniref:efflux RND transporter permease subunit n=1 Tax=Aliarcobacter butzleri TaxID=28197 RepID=UPI001EDBFE2E|nr:CusA/CzcA family heavy metal efflux RND transporter [Aliarcobacter butzleri]MCG3656636.1 CusA/CzcA family heavy metal efflux RND transporter [Aliarcobacter butzleri]MCG3710665.1 CusA/CzcA family heavy metal efflux RND transporter [Aliarcobacter butzleri]MCG3714525.1 CusA/CzcA family heavy metal efflux RND transporter [Aliarcobacter butzleri]
MLERIIDVSLKYKLIVIILFLIISIMGIKVYKSIPVDAFPDITPKQVIIYTESPGNSAEDIEKLITYPIESAMSGIAGVKTIMSNSIFGLSYVAVFFEDDMDIYFLRQLVNERLSSINIPEAWGKPTLGPNTTGLGQVFWYQLKDNTNKYSLKELREMQDYLVTPLFKGVKGVEDVIGWGGDEKQYSIIVDSKKLQNVNITYNDIVGSLQKSNQIAGGQYLEFNKEQYLIRGIGLYKTLDDIRKTVIKSENGQAITIEDIGIVEESSKPKFGAVSINGEEAVIGMILQRSQTNAAEVVSKIKEKLQTVNNVLPEGVEIYPIYDRTEITLKAVDTMTSALTEGIVLVIIILFLFLFELRSAFIVVVSLPLSLLIAFIFMNYYGISANLMSLSGLAIAVGMIVDGTIVIVENTFRKLSSDYHNSTKLEIVTQAAKEVAKPVTFAILVIVVAFIPLISLDGLAGKLYKPMALNIVFVMIASLIVALILVPVLCLLLLKKIEHTDNIIMRKIKNFYSPILVLALDNSKKLFMSIIFIFFTCVTLLMFQGREFMPTLKEESIMFRVTAIPGTSLTQSINSAQEIEKFILEQYPKEITSVLSMIGRSEKGETAQPNYMELLLTLNGKINNLELLTSDLNEKISKKFDYLQFTPTQPIAMRVEELLEGVKAELAIKVFGEDQEKLNKIATEIKEKISNVDGVEGIELESQLGQSQIKIEPNYSSLAIYGISIDEVMQVIKNGIGEEEITEKIEGIKRFGVVAKIKDAKKDIDGIKKITLRSSSGAIVNLDQICKISVVQGASFIKREDLNRYLVLSIEVNERDIASFVKEADEIIKKEINIPSGYYISWVGDFKNMQEATKKLMIIIPLTILLVMLLLFMAFNSIKKVGLILLNVPFGLIGAIISLSISGVYLSVSAIVGFIAIFAIAILNGIVLVSFIDELREKYPHTNLKILLKDATLLRLRPVLMTAFTALLGILPLLFATGVGSEIQYPLAVVVVGGVISSTILTLLILPSTYFLFYEKSQYVEQNKN